MLYVSSMVIISQHFRKRLSTATGLAICGSGIGTMVFAPFTRWLLDQYGWRGTLALLAALTLNCAACSALFIPAETTHEDKVRVKTKKKTVKIYLALLKNVMFLLTMVAMALTSMAYFTCYIFIPDLVVSLGYSTQQAALAISFIGIANTVSRAGLSWIGDTKCIDVLYIYVIVTTVVGMAVLGMPILPSYVLVITSMIIYGLSIGKCWCEWTILIHQIHYPSTSVS